MNDASREGIIRFLQEDVPGAGAGGYLNEWAKRCQSLGPNAPEVFLEVLKTGTLAMQYAALLGLRFYGYDAWAEGDGADSLYKVTAPNSTESITIFPLETDPPL